MTARRCLLLSALALAATWAAPAAWAQETAPLRIVVPYPPGGPLDATARVLAERVQGELGTVVVDNKPGAGGNIGMAAVAKAVPDGRTLGVAAVATLAINPWLFRKMPYDAARDFAPVTAVARVPNVLVMNAEAARQLKIASVADLIAYARENPGQLNYGSGGNGSAGHLAGELFKQQAGIEATHIPFNGANPAQLALLGGQVDFNIDNLASAAPNIKSGKLVALAVTSASPSPMLPGVPPLADTLKGFEIDTWWGLVAPAGTPAPVLQKLSSAFGKALASPQAQQRFAAIWAEPLPTTPEQFGELAERERGRYQGIVKLSGARVD
ncbi:Bug family tripartite tricarboxylate transporter substrate binding protein [Ottowia cancrivicina]|uniref:Tripartite tricarboxylate transporter substrate binding protein n=1 Tax=Ottowia cancrivicina TaxID=3040346 RepID=A0AAW6RLU0_9BURK|nr:tripartite tricarboxylate transporter substrate binding protein [Ottowia sp. 10c7w1]MDG9698350.1 tripartite tricarboxylate transporter substrate binding protein [Ottowia sp. 10c7w1]